MKRPLIFEIQDKQSFLCMKTSDQKFSKQKLFLKNVFSDEFVLNKLICVKESFIEKASELNISQQMKKT